jgi:Tol biopolymer transport system component
VPQRWSPDGERIAYEGWDDSDASRAGVYTARYPDGGDLERLTSIDDVHDIPTDYSPDGSHIVFYRTAPQEPWDVGGSLWIVDANGGDPVELDLGDLVPSWWARWSPDGSRIAFASARLQNPSAIWTIEPDGTNLTRLFEDEEGRFPITPTWSPDGSQIMFALDPIADEFQHAPNGIYVIDADGTGLTPVLADGTSKRRFQWVSD